MSGSRAPDLSPGDLFAGFRIEAVLGSGGMGTVYRALDLALDHERALKILTPDLTGDEDFRQRFQRESRLAARLEDEGVVPIYGAGEADGRLYIAMRLVRGPDLHRLVADTGPLSLARTAAVTAAVAGALDAAHANRIIHRDVKPANILVEPTAGRERVFLTDFGISRADSATTSITATGRLLGTPDYISPEQIEGGRAGPRSDVYALGCVVCFLLTGEPPFQRETPVATLYAHAHAERPRPSLLEPGLPPEVDEVVARATAVDPAERYATAGDLAADLAEAVDPSERPQLTAPVTPRTRELEPPRRRRRGAIALIALLAAAAVAVGAVVLWPDAEEDSPEAVTTGVATIDVGDPVDSIVVGEVNVLAGSHDASTLTTIDPEADPLQAGEPRRVNHPTAVAVGYGSVWVTSSNVDSLLRFGPETRDVAKLIKAGAGPADVAVGDSVWVVNRDDGTATEIDPPTSTPEATVAVSARPESVATEGEVAWVASPSQGSLTRIDSSSDGEPAAQPFAIGGAPADLAISGESLWMVDASRGTLAELSVQDGQPLREPIELGGQPVAVAVGPTAVWVADKARDLAIRVDPDRPAEPEKVEVGHRPVAIAVGAGSVWVTNAGDGTVTRITR